MSLVPIVNAATLYVNGLMLEQLNNTVTSITYGAARDSTNTNDIILPATTLLNIAASGINGLDTGTVAINTFYAVFVIGDSSNYHPTGTIMSLSPVSPTLPSGYDLIRRIGWLHINGSTQIDSFQQFGNGMNRKYYYYTPLTVLTGGTATSFAAGALNLTTLGVMPPFSVIKAASAINSGLTSFSELTLSLTYTAGSAANVAEFSNLAGATIGIARFGTGVAAAQVGQVVVPTSTGNSATMMNYRVVSGDSLSFTLAGYTDLLL